jgi:hypothetical protein
VFRALNKRLTCSQRTASGRAPHDLNVLMASNKGIDTPSRVVYTMCMHINTQSIISRIAQVNAEELDQLQEAIDRRRRQLGHKPLKLLSTVVERRDYGNGILQLEKRAYRRKDDGLTERGPYWYFHHREGGKQHTLYIGKSDNPEAVVDEKLAEEPAKRGDDE